jgi:hypothetical protein
MEQKNLNITFGVIIIVLVLAIAFLLVQKNANDLALKNNQTLVTNTFGKSQGISNSQTELVPTNTTQKTNSNTSSTNNSLVYTNKTYGFQLTLTKIWEGYVAKETPRISGDVMSIVFCVPTTDKQYSTSDCSKGYANPMFISIYSKEQWKQIQSEDGPKPDLITQNDKYVFTWSMWQDLPTDYRNTNLGFGAIVNSFKLLQ